MRSASRPSRAVSSETLSPAWAPAAKACFIRSIAQKRLTAVGRVAARTSARRWNSVTNCRVPVALLRRAPRASPIAAATPIAGAPRITIAVMALATSSPDRQRT